jgi:hypothetical protein
VQGPDDVGLPRAFLDAPQIAIANGDLARGRIFAERAVFWRKTALGDDSTGLIPVHGRKNANNRPRFSIELARLFLSLAGLSFAGSPISVLDDNTLGTFASSTRLHISVAIMVL